MLNFIEVPEMDRIQHLLNLGYYATKEGKVVSPWGRVLKKTNCYTPTKGRKPYILIQTKIEGIIRQIKAHRFIFYFFNGFLPDVLDHINGNTLDNRPENLRESNHIQNNQNRQGVKGYYKTKRGKFYAFIVSNGERHYLGSHATEEEARMTYLYWKSKLHSV